MNTKNVVSLELAKELKEAGYPQEGEFWWHKKFGEYYLSNDKTPLIKLEGESYIASLTSELVEKLPESLSKHGSFLSITKCNNVYVVEYSSDTPEFSDVGLCNALAELWLYLKKNNLLEEKND